MGDLSDFLDSWIADNIHAEAYVGDGDPRPAARAEDFLAAAEASGFSRAAVEAAFPALSDTLAEAINAAADAEVSRLAAKDK